MSRLLSLHFRWLFRASLSLIDTEADGLYNPGTQPWHTFISHMNHLEVSSSGYHGQIMLDINYNKDGAYCNASMKQHRKVHEKGFMKLQGFIEKMFEMSLGFY